jgi:hypothetical protein
LDTVRLLLGDDDATAYLWSDSQINAMLALHPSPYKAAYYLAITKSAYYARKTNRTIDGLTVSYSDMAGKFRDLADALKALFEENSLTGAALYVGGLDPAEKQTDSLNTGLSQPRFVTDQFRNDG